MIRIFSERNQQAFNTKLSKADWSPAYDADVNYSYSNFIKILHDAFEECFPLTRLSRKRMKDKPWITSAVTTVPPTVIKLPVEPRLSRNLAQW